MFLRKLNNNITNNIVLLIWNYKQIVFNIHLSVFELFSFEFLKYNLYIYIINTKSFENVWYEIFLAQYLQKNLKPTES